MVGKIIMWVVTFGCAALFFGIGVYAKKRKKPMWFWAGSEVDPAQITDVPKYNRANGTMWQLYSLWFWVAGLAEIWNSTLSVMLLCGGSTVGIIPLVFIYNSIYKKYKAK